MAHIAFIYGASSFDGASLRKRPLGGTETVVAQLAEALAAREKLGWEPKVSLEDGLKETIAYFRMVLA